MVCCLTICARTCNIEIFKKNFEQWEGFDTCDEDVVSIVKEGANKMSMAGAVVEDVSIPLHADGMWFDYMC